MVLPKTDCYAVLLVAFFVKLDGYAELTRPHKPPAPDQQVSNGRLQNSRSAAYEEVLKRWKIDCLQPWQQRKERHNKQKSAERRVPRRYRIPIQHNTFKDTKKSKDFFPREHMLVARGSRGSGRHRPILARARCGCRSIGLAVAH